MDQISLLAAAGLRSRMESVDMLANNLANTQTNGYKADREFYGVYVGEEAALGSDDPLAVRTPSLDGKWTDFAQGSLTPTGNNTDFALSGDGFFAARNGPNVLYTRNGSFKLTDQGDLVTLDKYPVLSSGDSPIRLTPNVPFEVSTDGTIRQNGADVAKLQVVRFSDPNSLTKQGGTYFQNNSSTMKATAAVTTSVYQGRVESSNVGAAESSVRLVGLLRQFEMLQKAISVSADMGHKADELARVSG